MSATGGDITEVTAVHPTVGTVRFYPKANETNTFNKGGIRNDDNENGVDGAGGLIVIKNRIRGGFEIVVANDMADREDLTNAIELAESLGSATWTVSIIDGTTWQGSGIICGALPADVNAATFSLKVAAPRFEKI